MPNCRFFNGEGLTGEFCTSFFRTTKADSSLHVNATGSADFDIQVQISNDMKNWATHMASSRLEQSEGNSPFLYGLDHRYRYVRICFVVREGALDVEAFLA